MNWKEQVEAAAFKKYPQDLDGIGEAMRSVYRKVFEAGAKWEKQRAEIQAAALPNLLKYLDDEKSTYNHVLRHIEFKPALPVKDVKEEQDSDRGNSNTDGVKKLL
jgi:hypothetical protein